MWQVTLAVMKYYKYPVKTQILHKKAGQLVFPAVTICNLNPLRLNLLSQAGNLLDGFKQVVSNSVGIGAFIHEHVR